MCTWAFGTEKGASRGYRLGIVRASLKFTSWLSKFSICWYCSTLSENRSMKQQQYEASQQRGKQNSAYSHGGLMETLLSNDNNLSQRSFTKQQQRGDQVSEEAIEMAQVQVESQWQHARQGLSGSWWICFTNDLRNQCPKWHYLSCGHR